MKHLVNKAVQVFEATFFSNPTTIFQAPGRVNLIGEHTDYNKGFVLPCAIDRGTVMAVSPRSDNKIRVVAASLDNKISEWAAELPVEKDDIHSWSNYLRGVSKEFLQINSAIKGMNVVAIGNIPQGAGLSSSASFSVVFATAINVLNNMGLTPTQIALQCQAAENDFVGCKCGIMDQLISAAGQAQNALLIDCNDLSFEKVSIPTDADILIIDSKVTRGLVDSEYNTRRAQCESAAKAMELDSLREADLEQLQQAKNKMDSECFLRARHVITENDRTRDAANALQNSNYTLLSELMAASHTSMRDDFKITVPQIDYLVELVNKVVGKNGGARMTGGGFGGCVVSIAPNTYTETIIDAIKQHYKKKTGLSAEIHLCKASSGAGILNI